MLEQFQPCSGFFVVAPLPANDFAAGDGDEKAPSRAEVNPVDLDLCEDFAGAVQERVNLPTPLRGAPERPSTRRGAFGLGSFAQYSVDEADEDVALGGVRSFETRAGVAVGTSPSLGSRRCLAVLIRW